MSKAYFEADKETKPCCSLQVYDALSGEVIRELGGHRSCVRDVSWHPFYPEIVSSSVSYNFGHGKGVSSLEIQNLKSIKL